MDLVLLLVCCLVFAGLIDLTPPVGMNLNWFCCRCCTVCFGWLVSLVFGWGLMVLCLCCCIGVFVGLCVFVCVCVSYLGVFGDVWFWVLHCLFVTLVGY